MLKFFAKRKLIKELSAYLDPQAVQDLFDGRTPDALQIRSGRIEFVFLFVRADSPQQLGDRIGLVADTGMEHNAVVHNVVGPMVVIAFGTLRAEEYSPTSRTELVSRLRERFGKDIKIVHGAADGHFGPFGSKNYLAFTFTFPQFDTALATLGRLEFGQTEELRS